ncbi:thrombospondin type 3 repeat-containing protein [Patescibacteria group bacterium]|nr:thrombospondin type 3 repeat-containing protein [Patescibacteria group bacterium]
MKSKLLRLFSAVLFLWLALTGLVQANPFFCNGEELLGEADFAIEGYVTAVACGQSYNSGECQPYPECDGSCPERNFMPELVADCAATIGVTANLKGWHNIGEEVAIPFVKLTQACQDGEYLIPGTSKKDFQLNSKVRFYNISDNCRFYNLEELEPPPEEPEAESPAESGQSLAAELKGRILLQVEANGEAWYVNPLDGKRIYLADGGAAFVLMTNLGLGITNADLAKIPVGLAENLNGSEADADNDGLFDLLEDGLGTEKNNPDSDGDGYLDGQEINNGYNPQGSGKMAIDANLANSVKGRILLQVENVGQAWYVNPADNKRYYMKNGPAAYWLMRSLSLGISNEDLAKIEVADY